MHLSLTQGHDRRASGETQRNNPSKDDTMLDAVVI